MTLETQNPNHSKTPWRKTVQTLLAGYGSRLADWDPLSPTQRESIRQALDALPEKYRTILSVLDCQDAQFPVRYHSAFPQYPRGLRTGLQRFLNVSLRTIDDWHAKALDQMAELLDLKPAEAHHAMPRSHDDDKGRRYGRCPKSDWWDSVDFRLCEIGRYAFLMSQATYDAEVQQAWAKSHDAHYWNRYEFQLAQSLPYSLRGLLLFSEKPLLPPDRHEMLRKSQELVANVLTTPRIRDLILDRYWDRTVNHAEHPTLSVAFYARRLRIGRTRYYQLWDEAMHKIANYWGIPIEEDDQFE